MSMAVGVAVYCAYAKNSTTIVSTTNECIAEDSASFASPSTAIENSKPDHGEVALTPSALEDARV
jgi:hypothetical protein